MMYISQSSQTGLTINQPWSSSDTTKRTDCVADWIRNTATTFYSALTQNELLMSEEREMRTNKTMGSFHRILCQECKIQTKHIVIVSANDRGSIPFGLDQIYDWKNDYEVVQCMGCETVSFRLEHQNSEDHFPDHTGYHYSDITIYPKRSEDLWNPKSFSNLPKNLERIYKETIDTYNNDNLTLCAAGCRALVEGLCKEKKIERGLVEIVEKKGTSKEVNKTNLEGKINGLYQQNILTKQQAETLHEHRFLGNTAIHELSPQSKAELKLAIEILESVFDSVFEMPNKANELKDKRESKHKK